MSELNRTRGEAIEGKSRPIPPLGGPGVGEDLPELSPADLLGLEHDLIRRVVRVLERRSVTMREGTDVDRVFLATIVDFIDTYADKVHHGKEEQILFQRLHDLPLSAEHRQMMEELAREHVEMRRMVEEIREASERYRKDDEGALEAIRKGIEGLVEMYPGHMETEDETFFPTAMEYLDDANRQAVLEEMRGYDRAMIHETYGSMAEELEGWTETWALSE